MIFLEILAITLYAFIMLGINEVWVKPYAMRVTRVLSLDLLAATLDTLDGWLIKTDMHVDDWHRLIAAAIAESSGDTGWLGNPKIDQAVDEVVKAFDPRVFASKRES